MDTSKNWSLTKWAWYMLCFGGCPSKFLVFIHLKVAAYTNEYSKIHDTVQCLLNKYTFTKFTVHLLYFTHMNISESFAKYGTHGNYVGRRAGPDL